MARRERNYIRGTIHIFPRINKKRRNIFNFENNHQRFRTVKVYEIKRKVFQVLSFSDSVSDRGKNITKKIKGGTQIYISNKCRVFYFASSKDWVGCLNKIRRPEYCNKKCKKFFFLRVFPLLLISFEAKKLQTYFYVPRGSSYKPSIANQHIPRSKLTLYYIREILFHDLDALRLLPLNLSLDFIGHNSSFHFVLKCLVGFGQFIQ